MTSLRRQPLTRCLLALALVCQLLLPAAHAQSMARDDGGLALLACGAGTPGFVAQLRERLPPELLASLDEAGADQPRSLCPVCSAQQPESGPIGTASGPSDDRVPAVTAAPGRMALGPSDALRLPPNRGPPQL